MNSINRIPYDWPNRQISRSVQVGGLHWHVQISGKGPLILLLHGTGSSTHSWAELTPLLNPEAQILNVDLPGHAFTQGAAVEDLKLEEIASNLIGLIPYSFTTTSHLIVTFTLSFSIFIGINIICIQRHKFHMMSLFIPSNTSFGLALLLVPIELISYIFRPISLGVRLFANLMAGHTLLKVIVGFSWSMLLLEDLLAVFHVLPLLILVVLMGLELGVALIQAYVFTILTCIYLNDAINLH